MYSLLYVSRAQIKAEPADLDGIVRVAASRNAAAGVTGALLFTGDRFAQWLEGPEAAVLDIMASISRDGRHCEIAIIDQGPAERRRFARWSLAYSGRSTFAAAAVERALVERDAADGRSARNLYRLLREFVRLG